MRSQCNAVLLQHLRPLVKSLSVQLRQVKQGRLVLRQEETVPVWCSSKTHFLVERLVPPSPAAAAAAGIV